MQFKVTVIVTQDPLKSLMRVIYYETILISIKISVVEIIKIMSDLTLILLASIGTNTR